ncbi:hypothetical protein DTO166G4_7140 [Paecilomyces variotii]|nr:hypothetical protein DTO166G4_7140 [Paecilomyces variotii]KAJ9227696.1 hypothetical protein DTO166G5_9243 [Paecilomyces variotii]KAJ9261913.1 hypothetical protein DTO195F2_3901 [Paecilomyces variotii]KAJ9285884.1 hypothetical protein DTO021C3_6593 [Paecilomyces variotii]KAJ9319796.1 hypothetical protein DTO027B3_9185 [Paecilomyces variotii]
MTRLWRILKGSNGTSSSSRSESNKDTPYSLSDAQKAHWLEHGFIKIPGCFSREAAAQFSSSVWTRLGINPNDKSTWHSETIHMPGEKYISIKEFAPKAHYAICELVGGEDRLVDWCKSWSDAFILNLGRADYNPADKLNLRQLEQWHVDGDFFTHFLDSPEQALLVVPLFTDIPEKGGGTAICTDGIGAVAKHLYDHPAGTDPFLVPQGVSNEERDRYEDIYDAWIRDPNTTRDSSFHELTGKAGDVYLLHPFMVHSISKNLLRNIRIITNPPVALKEPFNYRRRDGKFSLIEQKTLNSLGRPEGLPEWSIAGKRKLLK